MTSSEFEFSAPDSKSLRLVSRVTLVVSILLVATALLRLSHLVETGLLLQNGHLIFNFTDNMLELLSVVLPLAVLFVSAYQFFLSSRYFGAIVVTAGRDITLLGFAMNSLANGFYLFAFCMLLNIFRWSIWADEIMRCLARLK